MNYLHPEQHMTEPEPAKLPPSFEVFFEQHQREFLKRAHLRLRDRRDAEEAVITAGCKMHEKWDRILAHQNPMALVYKILNNTVTDYYRTISRNLKHERLLSQMTQPTSEDVHALRNYERLDQALDQLERTAPTQAFCVRLRHLEGFTYPEIADRLDISEGCAKTSVCRGLKTLRSLMNGKRS
ncbi:RNA polymerase sigma factor [Streptomyces sp. RK75]|uniref:RNA polymerase sigma factor n=1 Tax=Streptomyces sp. RK75 TaxID=2824895 RepID=UPI001B35C808|nr:sigma-70 family RNA polymerase sigma factor [Streptomyces sp. RK75]MBQ0867349.1 sigma-70 family RNA polymerase sigma factor [Streptomyces sp. RK75]